MTITIPAVARAAANVVAGLSHLPAGPTGIPGAGTATAVPDLLTDGRAGTAKPPHPTDDRLSCAAAQWFDTGAAGMCARTSVVAERAFEGPLGVSFTRVTGGRLLREP
jgi:hypothetical protein